MARGLSLRGCSGSSRSTAQAPPPTPADRSFAPPPPHPAPQPRPPARAARGAARARAHAVHAVFLECGPHSQAARACREIDRAVERALPELVEGRAHVATPPGIEIV